MKVSIIFHPEINEVIQFFEIVLWYFICIEHDKFEIENLENYRKLISFAQYPNTKLLTKWKSTSLTSNLILKNYCPPSSFLSCKVNTTQNLRKNQYLKLWIIQKNTPQFQLGNQSFIVSLWFDLGVVYYSYRAQFFDYFKFQISNKILNVCIFIWVKSFKNDGVASFPNIIYRHFSIKDNW